MVDFLLAVLLGVVEGITEFLPISSTGHLIVAQKLTGFKDSHDLFTVVIQLGAIAAVIWFYRVDLWQKTLGLFKREPIALNFWKILVLGTIPAGVLGLLFDKYSESITTVLVVAIALIVGGIILWVVDNKPVPTQPAPTQLDRITTKQALLIGLGQCIAMIPGVSRSGATIVTGLAVKLNRPTATAFSFYLSIPVLVLASAFKLVKYNGELSTISGGMVGLVVGMVTAFATALFAVSWLLRYITRHNFKPFAIYRIVLGSFLLLLIAFNII